MTLEELRALLRGRPDGAEIARDTRKALASKPKPKPQAVRDPTGYWELGHYTFISPVSCQGFNGACGKTPTAKIRSMTAYDNPALNLDEDLCLDCAEDYIAHWAERWDEYRSSIL